MKLEGDKVYLREIKEQDILDIQKIANDREVSKYVPFLPYPFTKKVAKEYFNGIKQEENKKQGEFGVFLKETNDVIGMFNLYKISNQQKSAEIGYWLGKSFWGKGYSDDAIKVILKYAFKTLKLHRVTAKVSARNTQSISFLKRNKFTFEGALRRAELYDEKWTDLEMYGILEEEF